MKSVTWSHSFVHLVVALPTIQALLNPGDRLDASLAAITRLGTVQPEHQLQPTIEYGGDANTLGFPAKAALSQYFRTHGKPSALTQQHVEEVPLISKPTTKLDVSVHGWLDQHHHGVLVCIALIAVILAALLYYFVHNGLKAKTGTSKEVQQSLPIPEPGPNGWSESLQCWRAVYVLSKAWLNDQQYKWKARGLVLLVFVHWLVREALWAFVISAANAEVINGISELHEKQDMGRVRHALIVWMCIQLLVSLPIFIALDPWVGQWFCISMRTYMTRHIIGSYLNGGGQAFYRIKMKEGENKIDNPDQRIGQDIAEIVGQIYNIYSSVLSAVFGCAMWATVFLVMGGPKLLLISLTASIVRIFVAYGCFGKRLVNSYQAMLWTAADLRYTLTRVRENAESVALSGGGSREQERSEGYFATHIDAVKTSTWVNMLYGSAMNFIQHWPSLIIWIYQIPQIAQGLLQMGDAIRVHQGYEQVSKVLDFFTTNLVPITVLQANAERLHQLWVACETENAMAGKHDPLYQEHRKLVDADFAPKVTTVEEISFKAADPPIAFALENVVVSAPGSSINVGGASVHCETGKGLLVSGASGLGKSSVLKALAGLWLTGDGTVKRAVDAEVVVLPPTCYIPQGTLLEVAVYPRKEPELGHRHDQFTRLVKESLRRAHLGHILQRWGMGGTSRDWAVILSPGERQRMGFARLFFDLALKTSERPPQGVDSHLKPLIAVLDESTSAVDVDMEALLYQEVREEMRKGRLIAIASVGHRPTLPSFHDTELQIGEQPAARANPGELLSEGDWQTPDGEVVPWRHFLLDYSTVSTKRDQ